MRYRHCVEKAGTASGLTYDQSEGPTGHRLWGRRNEEYIADFELVCRRSLGREEYDVFHWHFIQGADWKYCIEKIGIDKGSFFHRVYLLQEKLGRVFRELRPYALFPLDEYFSGIKLSKIAIISRPRIQTGDPLPMKPILDNTIVARTNVIEMPRRSDDVSRNYPLPKSPIKAA